MQPYVCVVSVTSSGSTGTNRRSQRSPAVVIEGTEVKGPPFHCPSPLRQRHLQPEGLRAPFLRHILQQRAFEPGHIPVVGCPPPSGRRLELMTVDLGRLNNSLYDNSL